MKVDVSLPGLFYTLIIYYMYFFEDFGMCVVCGYDFWQANARKLLYVIDFSRWNEYSDKPTSGSFFEYRTRRISIKVLKVLISLSAKGVKKKGENFYVS